MTAKFSESDSQSASPREDATWTHLVQSSVPGLGFLFEVTGKPWTAWLGVLGLVFAATIAGLLGYGGGMHYRHANDENYCEYHHHDVRFTILCTVRRECFRPTSFIVVSMFQHLFRERR